MRPGRDLGLDRIQQLPGPPLEPVVPATCRPAYGPGSTTTAVPAAWLLPHADTVPWPWPWLWLQLPVCRCGVQLHHFTALDNIHPITGPATIPKKPHHQVAPLVSWTRSALVHAFLKSLELHPTLRSSLTFPPAIQSSLSVFSVASDNKSLSRLVCYSAFKAT